MEAFDFIILDLVTDPSNVTSEQLYSFVKKQQQKKIWPEATHVLCQDVESNETIDNVYLVRRLFELKMKTDIERKTHFVLVTSTLLKKYWEKVCCSLFTPVHCWAVYGIPIIDQPLASIVNVDEDGVDVSFKQVLMTIGNPDDVHILHPNSIPEDMFNAGFSTRQGGVSSLAPLSSLNLFYTTRKMDPKAVTEENRRRLAVAAGFDVENICGAKVEHGNTVRIVEKDFKDSPAVKYDCLVTITPGVTLMVPGADCCTILLADTKTGACGALHSGWMGTVKKAVLETLKTMKQEYGTDPVDVKAAIGPSVEMECFSLKVSDAKPITDIDPSLTAPVKDKEGRVHVDLVRANTIMLEHEGVLSENIDASQALCTKCNDKLFFSNERDGFPFGNQVGFISSRFIKGHFDFPF